MVATAPALETVEERVTLPHVSWETYEAILADHATSSVPRFTFDRGVLEIMSPSPDHEFDADVLRHLVHVVGVELDIPFLGLGSTTFRRADLQRGFEPDGCFYIQNEPRMRSLPKLDLAIDPPPDLVIEMEVSHSAVSKLPIFAQFGVPEVWRCRERRVTILELVGDAYQGVPTSRALPPLTDEAISRFLDDRRRQSSTEWVRAIQAWLRSQSLSD